MGRYLNVCQTCQQTIYLNRYDGQPITNHEDLTECVEALAKLLVEVKEKLNIL